MAEPQVTIPQKAELVPETNEYGLIRESSLIGCFQFKKTTQERNSVPIRRRGFPMAVLVKPNSATKGIIYLLKQEPGTQFTTDGDWETLVTESTGTGGTTSESFKGYYDAAGNSPDIITNKANYNSGDYFRVLIAGQQDLGTGIVQMNINDKVQLSPTTSKWIVLTTSGEVVQTSESINGNFGSSIDETQQNIINGNFGDSF